LATGAWLKTLSGWLILTQYLLLLMGKGGREGKRGERQEKACDYEFNTCIGNNPALVIIALHYYASHLKGPD